MYRKLCAYFVQFSISIKNLKNKLKFECFSRFTNLFPSWSVTMVHDVPFHTFKIGTVGYVLVYSDIIFICGRFKLRVYYLSERYRNAIKINAVK